jgi:hypothetical protein
MVATKSGLERWWTACPVGGDESVGGKLLFYFGDEDPSAVMEIAENTPDQVAWRCVDGVGCENSVRTPRNHRFAGRTLI